MLYSPAFAHCRTSSSICVSHATDGMVPLTPFLTSPPVSPFVAFITFRKEMDSKEAEAGRWSKGTAPCPVEGKRGCGPEGPWLKETRVSGNLDQMTKGRSLSQGLYSCEVSEIISNGGAGIFPMSKPKQRTSATHFIDTSGGI